VERDCEKKTKMALTIIKFLPFALVGLTILLGGHYLLYRSWASLFNLTSPAAKNILLMVLFLLAVSFFVAEVLAHFRQGIVTKSFYFVASAWVGFFINFLLAAGLIWLLGSLVKLTGISFNARLVAAVIFFLAIIVSFYGIWNAFHTRIKNIEVSIKNLTLEWQGKTVVQLSDVHLGHIYGADFLQGVVEKVNALQPDLVMITGDLFDGMDGDLSGFVAPLNNIKSKEGIFFVIGNHEMYLGLARALAVLDKTKIKVLNDEFIDVDGLQIVGISYPDSRDSSITGSSKDTSAIINSFQGYDKSKPSILLHHAPTNIEQAKASGVSLQLSGHTHQGQLWPLGYIIRAIFGKYSYGFYTEDDFSIYTSCGVGTWGPPMRTGNTPEIVAIKLK